MKNIKSIIGNNRRIIISIAMLFVFCCFLSANSINAQKMIQAKLNSKVLKQTRDFIILLPKSYDSKSEQNYPVIYMLDSSGTIAREFTALTEKKVVPETILVGIRMMKETRNIDLLPSYMKAELAEENSPMGRADKFLNFMESELMPYLKKNYKVSDVNAISGHSRGGVLVMYSLLAKPNLFQARFAFSPAVWREKNLIAKKTKKFFKANNVPKSFLYLSLGEKENDKMKKGFDSLTKVLTKHSNKELIWHSKYIKDANHQTNVKLSISDALTEWGKSKGTK